LIAGGPALFGGQPTWNAEDGNAWGVQSADDAIAKVRRLHDAGIRWLALHSLTRFQPGELEAIVAEARRLGLRLLAGGDQLAEIERAVAIGVDSIEYLDRGDTARYGDELLAAMQAQGARLFLIPVIGYPHRFAAYRNGTMSLEDPRFTEFMPPEVATAFSAALLEDRTKQIQWAPNDGTIRPAITAKFRQLHAAGLRLVAGTDCGSPVHLHADAIWWELETMRQLGLSPDECIRAATTTAAALLFDPEIGHLRPGARGDFVLIRGRLADGPLSVERVRTVARGGVLAVDDGRWLGP
jgi:imidazolonepropionase-like amidohydrolase